jgi:CheY-like chemotaxis protein
MDSQLTTTAPGYRWKDLLLGPPLATSRLVRERLRKLVALFAALNRLASVNVAVVHPPPPPRRPMSFQLAGMRAGNSSCDPEAMVRCLIVDDSPRFLEAARGLLERQGVTVVGVASNSADALQRAGELRPDVTLLDIDLGGESGLELARRLHGEAGQAPAPVILISTHAEQDYAELIAASPAIGFLAKTALSGDAIRDLLAGHRDGGRRDPRP